MQPLKLTITGADDADSLIWLSDLSSLYPRLEWAILYFPAKEGSPRYPTEAWRQDLLELRANRLPHMRLAMHLCANATYRDILEDVVSDALVRELACYDRIQVNINARGRVFSDQELKRVYTYLQAHTQHLILQYHPDSELAIREYLEENPYLVTAGKVSVLLDASGGRGISPESWPTPLEVQGNRVLTGYAGGLGPDNLRQVAERIAAYPDATNTLWLDMESKVRDRQNRLSIDAVGNVLDILYPTIL